MEVLTRTGPKDLVLPRFGTPRNPDRPTRGHEVDDVAHRLGLPMMPHLRHMADVLYEYDPDTSRQLYETGDIFVMRQVGKTMGFMTPAMVHRCTRVPSRLGKQRVLVIIKDRQTTREKLEKDIIPLLDEAADSFRRITNRTGRPGRSRREWRSTLNNGHEGLQFGQSNHIVISPPTKKVGHSQTLDLVCFDEIRFAVDDRVEQGVDPTMITRPDRMLLRASTAGDEESFYMWPLVLAGRQRCESGEHGIAAYFEYSIPDDADLHDPEVWYEYHPAVGRTISIDDILNKLQLAEDSPDPSKLDIFRQEYANQWVRHPVLGEDEYQAVLTAEAWEHKQVMVSANTEFVGTAVLGVDVAPKGGSAAIDVVGQIGDGRRIVKVLDVQAGTWWLETALVDLGIAHNATALAFDATGPAKAMIGAFARAAGSIAKATGRPCELEKLGVGDFKAASQAMVSGITEHQYGHVNQEWLNNALGGATKSHQDGAWSWVARSEYDDITALRAATAAFWAYELNPAPPPRRSAYEDNEFMTV